MGGGGGGSGKTKTKDIIPTQFQSLRDPLSTELAALFGAVPVFNKKGEIVSFEPTDGGVGIEDFTQTFPGSLFAPLNDQESELLKRTAAGSTFDRALSDLELRTIGGEFLRPESNPFLADTIRAAQRPVIEAFQETIRGDVANFLKAGQRLPESSPFARARAIRERGLADALSDVSTALSAQNFQAERARQIEVARDSVTRNIEQLRAQALPRLVEDLGVQRGIEEFNRRISVLLTLLGTVAQLTSPTTGTFGSQFAFKFNASEDAPEALGTILQPSSGQTTTSSPGGKGGAGVELNLSLLGAGGGGGGE